MDELPEKQKLFFVENANLNPFTYQKVEAFSSTPKRKQHDLFEVRRADWLFRSTPLLDVTDTVTNANLRMYDAGSHGDISLTVNTLVVSLVCRKCRPLWFKRCSARLARPLPPSSATWARQPH
jgi:hypothetical protein